MVSLRIVAYARSAAARRPTVAMRHCGRLRAGEVHPVAFAAALSAEGLGQGVSETMRVDVVEAGEFAAAAEQLCDAGVSELPLGAEPHRGQLRLRVIARIRR